MVVVIIIIICDVPAGECHDRTSDSGGHLMLHTACITTAMTRFV